MKSLFLTLALAVATSVSALSADMTKLAYPTSDDPSFIITVPDDWELKQAEEEGDFFHLNGPTGTVFSFRTIKGTESSLNKAIEDSIEEVGEKFKDVKLGDPEDWKPGGLTGIYLTGAGKDKEDGTAMTIGMGWCALEDGKIAEFWFVGDLDDAKGIAAAEKIANSLKAP